jgi:hypothetical protein
MNTNELSAACSKRKIGVLLKGDSCLFVLQESQSCLDFKDKPRLT